MKLENLPDLVEAGVRRAVIVSGILQAEDPSQRVADIRAVLEAV